MNRDQSIKQLMSIPSIGKSIANDLWNIGIMKIEDLKGKDPQALYELSNNHAGVIQDRCLLYCFRCAVYYVNTPPEEQNPKLRLWWNHKDFR
ncbi:MAG: pathogenicity locus [Bacteroidetes bacterium]|nr:pathogenicity locus [Bacteroidota bacterium]